MPTLLVPGANADSEFLFTGGFAWLRLFSVECGSIQVTGATLEDSSEAEEEEEEEEGEEEKEGEGDEEGQEEEEALFELLVEKVAGYESSDDVRK